MSRTEEFAAGHEVSYHLTDNPHFKLDPHREPEDNSLSLRAAGGTKPGLYVTKHPDAWVNGHDYVRPYVAEIHHPAARAGGFGSEDFIPADHFDKVKVARVIPLDAHARETFHEPGWVEEYHGTAFDTKAPLHRGQFGRVDEHYPDYHYRGPDVRDMPAAEHRRHAKRTQQYLRAERPQVFSTYNHQTDEFDTPKPVVRRTP